MATPVITKFSEVPNTKRRGRGRLSSFGCGIDCFGARILFLSELNGERELAEATLVVVAAGCEPAKGTPQLGDLEGCCGWTAVVEVGVDLVVMVVEEVEGFGAELAVDFFRETNGIGDEGVIGAGLLGLPFWGG